MSKILDDLWGTIRSVKREYNGRYVEIFINHDTYCEIMNIPTDDAYSIQHELGQCKTLFGNRVRIMVSDVPYEVFVANINQNV